MSPAMVQPHTTGEIIIVGGNHPLAAAGAKRTAAVSDLFEPDQVPFRQARLPSFVALATHSA